MQCSIAVPTWPCWLSFFSQWHLVQDVKVAPSLEADTNTEIISGILGIFSDKHFKKQILIEICHLEKFSPLLRYVKYLTNFQIFSFGCRKLQFHSLSYLALAVEAAVGERKNRKCKIEIDKAGNLLFVKPLEDGWYQFTNLHLNSS